MASEITGLDAQSLARLRKLVSAMHAENGTGVPLASLVALQRDLHSEAGLTIDFEATEEIGSPMVVVRVAQPPPDPARLGNLTKRESEVARLIAGGLTNAEIAKRLFISVPTVKDHVHRILQKTGLKRRTRLVAALLDQSAR